MRMKRRRRRRRLRLHQEVVKKESGKQDRTAAAPTKKRVNKNLAKIKGSKVNYRKKRRKIGFDF
jgi:hypothetical protein